jgi:hypothetical protein
MFAGVKFLGSLQTAILAIAEIAVALVLAFLVLHERLTIPQIIGAGILVFSILLVRPSDLISKRFNPANLVMLNIATQQFQWIAFHRAFGKEDLEKEDDVMTTLTTAELQAIRDMMGVDGKPLDPFPINPAAQYSVDLSVFLQDEAQPENDDAKTPQD